MSNFGLAHDQTEMVLELTDEVRQQDIVTSFVFNRKKKLLILSLNHKHSKKTILSPVFEFDWPKTIKTFIGHMELKGVSKDHSNQLCDVVDNNFENILNLNDGGVSNERNDNDHDDNQGRKQKEFIRKYTGNGTLPLHESILISGQKPVFLSITSTGKPQFIPYIETATKIVYPCDTEDTQSPLPYSFESIQELEHYLELASTATFETLYATVESTLRKYVNAEDHYITILSADIIYSYLQDKFSTTHYNIFVGDNGSGKNSALLAFKFLGYRVFYIVSASAPNYFTFLGDREECQGSTAEDEAEDIGYDKEKRKLLKAGYASGGIVPKIELSPSGRKQDPWLAYCHKWFAMEELPDYKTIKGLLDRSFIYNFVVGRVPYNIKDVIRHSGDEKFKQLHDELVHIRKLLFAFRMIHHKDAIPDIKLNVIHRNEELTKPLLRLFSYRNDAPIALKKIRLALSKFVLGRNESKKNSIESKLLEAIKNLINVRKDNPKSEMEEFSGLEPYAFYNEQIWAQVRSIMDGKEIHGKVDAFYSTEYGAISHKRITGLYKSKLKAGSIKINNKRGLKFSKQGLDRLDLQYDVPDEIIILSTDSMDSTCRDKEGVIDDTSGDKKHQTQSQNDNMGSENDENKVVDSPLISTTMVQSIPSVPKKEVSTLGTDSTDHRNIEGIKEDTVDIEKSSNIAPNDNQKYILGNNISAENPTISHTTVQSVPSVQNLTGYNNPLQDKRILFWSRLTDLTKTDGSFTGDKLQQSLVGTAVYGEVTFLIKAAVANGEIEAVEGQYDTYRMVASKRE
jgi:hypothetical protein